MPSLHLSATQGQVAETVLLPGDPLRARHIAQSVLDTPECHNTLRNMLGYTGGWAGGRLSVQATGMGAPSMGVYATELFSYHRVRTAVRVGTCAAVQEQLQLGDLVVAVTAGSDSRLAERLVPGAAYCPSADFALACAAVTAARREGWRVHVGPIMSSDVFYAMDLDVLAALADVGALALDMETAALYAVAAQHGVRALSVLTVTDHLARPDAVPAAERETLFGRGVTTVLGALNSVVGQSTAVER